MNHKMTAGDAAKCLGVKEAWVARYLREQGLPCYKSQNHIYFGHKSARALFNFQFCPQIIVFQVVKGGVGKTSLAHEVAIRSHLYGARVLCIDLDQQGNLTHALNVDANEVPVMVDILAEDLPLQDAIITVDEGLDLIASRIENALLNEVIRLKNVELTEIYRPLLYKLKRVYDVIIVDCPPTLDQSVSAMTLAADMVLSPVVPERFSLEGLRISCESIQELQAAYGMEIPSRIVLNKFDSRTVLSQEALALLTQCPLYKGKLLSTFIRLSQDYPNAVAKERSIFDVLKPSSAKEDIDGLTKELLNINMLLNDLKPKSRSRTTEKLSY